MFHRPRCAPAPGSHIVISGARIAVESTMKYLGLVLDSRWEFGPHFRRLAPKLMGAVGALSTLLLNLVGPSASCRQLYVGIVRSMALYGAPVWAMDMTAGTLAILRKPQRAMAVRVVRGYRTISYEAACVLARPPPWAGGEPRGESTRVIISKARGRAGTGLDVGAAAYRAAPRGAPSGLGGGMAAKASAPYRRPRYRQGDPASTRRLAREKARLPVV